MAPTILAALEVPTSVEHDGRVLPKLVGQEASVAAAEASSTDVGPGDEGLDADEAAEVEEHLRGLGYLE
jgi:hypothetical protein